jgi:hypothetical protein
MKIKYVPVAAIHLNANRVTLPNASVTAYLLLWKKGLSLKTVIMIAFVPVV